MSEEIDQTEQSEETTAKPTSVADLLNPKYPVKVTDIQKEQFFKAFLSDEPYTEEFSLMQGKMKVVFKTLDVSENADIMKQQQLDNGADISRQDDWYMFRIISYRLGMAIVSINGVPFADGITADEVEPDTKAATSYISERIKIFEKWPIFKLSAVQSAYAEFERRTVRLTEEVANPDFWKAAE